MLAVKVILMRVLLPVTSLMALLVEDRVLMVGEVDWTGLTMPA